MLTLLASLFLHRSPDGPADATRPAARLRLDALGGAEQAEDLLATALPRRLSVGREGWRGAALAAGRDLRVVALRGTTWLTRDGDRADHLLEPGDGFVVRRGESVFLAGLSSASVLVLDAAAPCPSRDATAPGRASAASGVASAA